MSAYAVEKLCRRLMIDMDFRATVAADPAGALADASPPLDDGERRALLDGDVGTLARAGANPFLLCQLGRLGLFGLDLPGYADRIRAEYAAERATMTAAGFGSTGRFGTGAEH